MSFAAWRELAEDSIVQEISTNVLLERMIQAYVSLPLPDEPLSETERRNQAEYAAQDKEQHTLRILDSVWQDLRIRAVQEKRSAAALIEQIVREHYGIDQTEQPGGLLSA
jgi:hypothetical protein